MKLALVLIGFFATSAAAQTTDCVRDYWGNIRCTTQQSSGVDWGAFSRTPDPGKSFNDGYEQGQRIRLMREQQRLIAEQRKVLEEQRLAQQSRPVAPQPPVDLNPTEPHKIQALAAARMVLKGDCAGAEKYALEQGNIELAGQVKDYCAKK